MIIADEYKNDSEFGERCTELQLIVNKYLPGNTFSSDSIGALCAFHKILKTWNERFNLTARIRWNDYIRYHVMDSLAVLKCNIVGSGSRVMDIGSGPGIPGIIVKCILQDIHLMSVESIGKKAEFQRVAVEEMSINDIEIINDRVENIARGINREEMDVILVRAVDKIPVLLEYSIPLLKVGGKVAIYKGRDIEGEIEGSKNALIELGGEIKDMVKYTIDDEIGPRNLVIVKKVCKTDNKYPRKTGVPHKRPLK